MKVTRESRGVWLKLEAENPSGSVKYRTATSLVRQLETEGRLDKDSVLLESTSGNLGIALALVARQRGLDFCAVVDPKAQQPLLSKMRALGAMVEMVDEADPQGSYLDARIARVRELLSSSPGYVWTDQYESPANPAAHAATTGPELWRQSRGAMDAVFIAVSTGGTLAGVARYLRSTAPQIPVIAVDAIGSFALGYAAGPRRLTGIGSSRTSTFIEPGMYESSILVDDAEAFAMCRALKDTAGIMVGGSSGAVLSACSRYLEEHPAVRHPVCLCADDGANYSHTIFSDSWLDQNDLYPLDDQRWRFA
jgi:2,3-diaminopropionate biosynthesis protein SbnA